MYSTITKKKCKCGCDRWPTVGYAGYNQFCAPQLVADVKKSKNRRAKSAKNKRLAAKIKKLHTPQNDEAVELQMWYNNRMINEVPVCANCGASNPELKLNPKLRKLWKSCQAHLLPKKIFKSIKTHPLNGMVLGAGFGHISLCYCHDDYDHDWERASKMNIWPEVVRRFKILYPLIAPNERKSIPQILYETL